MSQGQRDEPFGTGPDSLRLCLHYYSNYVTLRIAEDDEEEYRVDQIKEFDSVNEAEWDSITAAYGEAGWALVY